MAKRKQNNQTNQYDKIFRENMEAALPGIMEHLLGLHIVSSEELPDDVQHTKERRPDLLKKVTHNTGKIYVLHMEYQAKNDMDMAYRMAEYSIMLQRKYRLDVKQYVIFIGMGKSRMPQSIQSEDFHFKYHLMALSAIDYKIFLKSDRPEEKSFAGSDLAEDRYFNQLRMLVQLRNLETQFDEAMEAITKFFKEEKDPFFRRGEAKGREEGIKETALKMKKSGLEISLIANITGLSVEEVEKL
jgi:predicted transposase YdaD